MNIYVCIYVYVCVSLSARPKESVSETLGENPKGNYLNKLQYTTHED